MLTFSRAMRVRAIKRECDDDYPCQGVTRTTRGAPNLECTQQAEWTLDAVPLCDLHLQNEMNIAWNAAQDMKGGS